MSKKNRTLQKVVQNYDRDRELSPLYVAGLMCSVRRFDRFLGRKSTIADLKPKRINEWMRYELLHTDLSDQSRDNGMKNIITLAKYVKKKIKRSKIRKIKIAPKNPAAWDFEELKTVADAMGKLPGVLPNGVPRSTYFATLVWFAYETGLRRRDLWDFRSEWLVQNNAALSQHKTKNMHLVEVTDQTLAGFQQIARVLQESGHPDAETPLRWPQSESQFYYWFRKARKLAGIDADVCNRALQHLRRTGATEVKKNGGEAWRYLGHTAEGLDHKSYVDRVKTAKAIMPTLNREQAIEEFTIEYQTSA